MIGRTRRGETKTQKRPLPGRQGGAECARHRIETSGDIEDLPARDAARRVERERRRQERFLFELRFLVPLGRAARSKPGF